MIRHIINRPIGTCIIAISLCVLGIIAIKYIPISLLPNLPVPDISIRVNYPGADANHIQQTLSIPIKNQLLQLNHLDDIEAISSDGVSTIKLRFNYGTDIDLAYLETNEKLDALMAQLPKDIKRPIVIKAGASDIPVLHLDIIPKDERSINFLQVSELCTNIIKRRLEQIPEVALVDITGQAVPHLIIKLDINKLQNLGINPSELANAINDRNSDNGNIKLKDNIYEYNIKIGSNFTDIESIKNTFITLNNSNNKIIRLGDVANIKIEEQYKEGLYIHNNNRAIGISIIKKPEAQLLKLKKELEKHISELRLEYSSLNFNINQDQSELLDLSISNLISSITTGAILTIIMIFFFMKDYRIVFIIALVLPISLTITILGFLILGISANIISLAGLVLGIGEIIDSAIIIIENIKQHQNENKDFTIACVEGTEEVIRPLFTSILTNSAVFIPLIFISGIAGALFMDQAIAVTLSLGISLLTSYILVPVLCKLILKKGIIEGETAIMKYFTTLYEWVFRCSFKYSKVLVIIWLLLIFSGIYIALNIKKSGMPKLSHTEMELSIDWNEPLTVEESRYRLNILHNKLLHRPQNFYSYIGKQQYFLNTYNNQTNSEASVIMEVRDNYNYSELSKEIYKVMNENYPDAIFTIKPSQNVFEQLFRTGDEYLQLKVFNEKIPNIIPEEKSVNNLIQNLKNNSIEVSPIQSKPRILLQPKWELLTFYHIDPESLIQVLKSSLGQNYIGTINSNNQSVIMLLGDAVEKSLKDKLDNLQVLNKYGYKYSINSLIEYHIKNEFSSLRSDKNGSYIKLSIENGRKINMDSTLISIKKAISNVNNITLKLSGLYFRDQKYIRELSVITLVSILLLFLILAAQFESLTQPFIVLIIIIYGISGALIGLQVMNQDLNIMSLIGFIVLIGLLDNDSILKIDTMNKSREQLSIMNSIKDSGHKRLQSQLMTYFTTALGLLPILWTKGLGGELQISLAVSVIFGMSIGIIISWTFIPLTYYWMYKPK